MTTASHPATNSTDSVAPIVLTTVTLVVAFLAAAASPWLMPLAGTALAYVGWSSSDYDAPRSLAYPAVATGALMLTVGVAASA